MKRAKREGDSETLSPRAHEPKSSKITAYRRPVRRLIRIEGVPIVVTLTDRALHFRVWKSHKHRYALSLSGLCQTAILEAKHRHPTVLGQEEMDLRARKEDRP